MGKIILLLILSSLSIMQHSGQRSDLVVLNCLSVNSGDDTILINSDYGAGQYYNGNPVGGGKGYNNIIKPNHPRVKFKVSTNNSNDVKGLLYALNHVSNGDIIYINDDASIDLSGLTDIYIPAGVTLASGRGHNSSAGGLIFTNDQTSSRFSVFLRPRSHVTLNGIRLRGPDGNPAGISYMNGIRTSTYHGIVIENCEIYNWPYAAIEIHNDKLGDFHSVDKAWIHHNYIHHNQRNGLGYGVNVGAASVLIEGNIFDYNRHHVAGNRSLHGTPTTNYEVRYNILMNTNRNSLVDCHGGNDPKSWGNPNDPDVTTVAGGILLIHHNTFTVSDQNSVGIRGIPAVVCRIYNNWTSVTTLSKGPCDLAFRQRLENLKGSVVDGKPITGDEYVRMEVYNNKYGLSSSVIY